ncbi:hypothetical protein [Telluria beijingensis]|uniref:hypothetical protein n=1 Tax=Telluria beijingensis TaxID=3068633 RepID=UPI002795B5ED|nr:hypothetical protein [Massilia sp. REN29]
MSIHTIAFKPRFAWWFKPAVVVVLLLGRAFPSHADRMIDVIVDRGVVMEPV